MIKKIKTVMVALKYRWAKASESRALNPGRRAEPDFVQALVLLFAQASIWTALISGYDGRLGIPHGVGICFSFIGMLMIFRRAANLRRLRRWRFTKTVCTADVEAAKAKRQTAHIDFEQQTIHLSTPAGAPPRRNSL